MIAGDYDTEPKLDVRGVKLFRNLFVCKSHEIHNETLFIYSEVRGQ